MIVLCSARRCACHCSRACVPLRACSEASVVVSWFLSVLDSGRPSSRLSFKYSFPVLSMIV